MHVTNWLPMYHETWGGAEQAAYNLIKIQAEKGIKVYVISSKPIKIPKENFIFFHLKLIEDYFGNFKELIRKFKIGIFPIDLLAFFSFFKILRKVKPDILHLHNFNFLSFSLIWVAKLLNVPIVLSVYDYWYFCPTGMLFDTDRDVCKKYHGTHCSKCLKEKYGLSPILTKPLLFFRKYLFNYFLNDIDIFITLSESSARILRKYGIQKNKINIIPLFFKPKKIISKKDKKLKNIIFYAGWIVPHKGLDILIKAMPYILEKVSNAKLCIFGLESDKKYKEEVVNLIKNLNLEKNIFWSNKRSSDPEFKKFFYNAKVIVIPEQWENMSPVICAEAMINSKVVIASRIGGIPEMIIHGKTGFLAEPKNPKDFAKKIVSVLKNKIQKESIVRSARKCVTETLDESKNLEKLLNVYNKLINGDRHEKN